MEGLYELLISDEASDDLTEAVAYYESQRKGLGMGFALSFEEATEILSKSPLMYQRILREVRRMKIDKFPYLIFYSVDGHQVNIFAVLHANRNPKFMESRISISEGG